MDAGVLDLVALTTRAQVTECDCPRLPSVCSLLSMCWRRRNRVSVGRKFSADLDQRMGPVELLLKKAPKRIGGCTCAQSEEASSQRASLGGAEEGLVSIGSRMGEVNRAFAVRESRVRIFPCQYRGRAVAFGLLVYCRSELSHRARQRW